MRDEGCGGSQRRALPAASWLTRLNEFTSLLETLHSMAMTRRSWRRTTMSALESPSLLGAEFARLRRIVRKLDVPPRHSPQAAERRQVHWWNCLHRCRSSHAAAWRGARPARTLERVSLLTRRIQLRILNRFIAFVDEARHSARLTTHDSKREVSHESVPSQIVQRE